MQDGLVELNPVNLYASVSSSLDNEVLHTLNLVSHRKSYLCPLCSCRNLECCSLVSCYVELTALWSLDIECNGLRSLLAEVELVESNLVTSLSEYGLPTLEVVSCVKILDSSAVDSAVTVDIIKL